MPVTPRTSVTSIPAAPQTITTPAMRMGLRPDYSRHDSSMDLVSLKAEHKTDSDGHKEMLSLPRNTADE
jgi:hypothetical protein